MVIRLGFYWSRFASGRTFVGYFNVNPSEILDLPIALQEMVFAVWLIVKGFNPTALASEPAKTEMDEAQISLS